MDWVTPRPYEICDIKHVIKAILEIIMWHPVCEHIKLTIYFNGEMDLEHDREQAKYVRTSIYIHTFKSYLLFVKK